MPSGIRPGKFVHDTLFRQVVSNRKAAIRSDHGLVLSFKVLSFNRRTSIAWSVVMTRWIIATPGSSETYWTLMDPCMRTE